VELDPTANEQRQATYEQEASRADADNLVNPIERVTSSFRLCAHRRNNEKRTRCTDGKEIQNIINEE
jgi:hypothetical protein